MLSFASRAAPVLVTRSHSAAVRQTGSHDERLESVLRSRSPTDIPPISNPEKFLFGLTYDQVLKGSASTPSLESPLKALGEADAAAQTSPLNAALSTEQVGPPREQLLLELDKKRSLDSAAAARPERTPSIDPAIRTPAEDRLINLLTMPSTHFSTARSSSKTSSLSHSVASSSRQHSRPTSGMKVVGKAPAGKIQRRARARYKYSSKEEADEAKKEKDHEAYLRRRTAKYLAQGKAESNLPSPKRNQRRLEIREGMTAEEVELAKKTSEKASKRQYDAKRMGLPNTIERTRYNAKHLAEKHARKARNAMSADFAITGQSGDITNA